MCLLQGPPSQIPQCLRGGSVALEAAGSVLVPTFPAPRPGEAVFLTRGHTVARPRRIRGQSRKVMGADVGDRGQPLLRVLREQAPNKGWPRPLLPVPSSPPGEHGAQNIPAPARLGGRACLHRGPQPGLWGPRAGHLRGACWTKGPGGHAHAVLLDRPLCWRDPAGCPAAPSGTGRGQGWWERMSCSCCEYPRAPRVGSAATGRGAITATSPFPRPLPPLWVGTRTGPQGRRQRASRRKEGPRGTQGQGKNLGPLAPGPATCPHWGGGGGSGPQFPHLGSGLGGSRDGSCSCFSRRGFLRLRLFSGVCSGPGRRDLPHRQV